MLKHYSNNLHKNIGYIELITYFLQNFRNIHRVEDLVSEYQGKILDITYTQEQQIIKSMEVTYPGEHGYSFAFKEDNRSRGIFDIDFIDNTLANFRVQLFIEGFLSFIKINSKYVSVQEFIIEKYGEGIDKLHVYDKTWYDKNNGLIITLRKLRLPRSSISLAITAEEFSPSFISLIQEFKS